MVFSIFSIYYKRQTDSSTRYSATISGRVITLTTDSSHSTHIRCQRLTVCKMIERTNIDGFTCFFDPRLWVFISVKTRDFFFTNWKKIEAIHTCQLKLGFS